MFNGPNMIFRRKKPLLKINLVTASYSISSITNLKMIDMNLKKGITTSKKNVHLQQTKMLLSNARRENVSNTTELEILYYSGKLKMDINSN